MEVSKYNIPSILPDNDLRYIELLQALLVSNDPLCTLEITGKLSGYSFRIAPSAPTNVQSLLEDIKRFNTMLNIQVDFSKSMRTGLTICYDITKV